uniref:Uncharacterized protein n=1 Tax=viral metagenome TaxID=1070528 RepID=A0A6C0CYB2_9ZZZZ
MLINNYATAHNSLFFCEALFNTIAFHNNLVIINPDELSTIVYRANYHKETINRNNLYHPIKNIELQYKFREFLTSTFKDKK